jgi:flagellar hook assembly protein FlgD
VARLQVLTAPNPSAGGVVIRCLLPTRALTTLELFDASGRMVRRLHDGELPAGATALSWDGRDDAEREVPAGVYLVKVTTPTGETSGRVVLTR